jgi:NADPH:quinone reductase
LQWVSEGALRPRIDRVLRLDQAPEAMTAIQNRSVSGRIVLQVR